MMDKIGMNIISSSERKIAIAMFLSLLFVLGSSFLILRHFQPLLDEDEFAAQIDHDKFYGSATLNSSPLEVNLDDVQKYSTKANKLKSAVTLRMVVSHVKEAAK